MKITVLIISLLFMAGLFACTAYVGEDPPAGAAEESAAPDFTLETVGGEKVVFSELLDTGKKAVLVFWTTWCGYCVQAVPAINEFYALHGGDVELLGINIRESREHVAGFVSARDVQYPVALDSDGAVSRMFAVAGVPAYYLFSAEGELIYSGHSFDEVSKQGGF